MSSWWRLSDQAIVNAHAPSQSSHMHVIRDKFSNPKSYFFLKLGRRSFSLSLSVKEKYVHIVKLVFVSSGLCARKRHIIIRVNVSHLVAVHFFCDFSSSSVFFSFSPTSTCTHTLGVFYCGTVAKRGVKYEFNWLEWMSFRSGLPLSSFLFVVVTVVAACKPVDKI